MSDVIVVGAGPVGLWLAAELRLRGIGAIVLEPRLEPTPHSKALTIHPRTLELFAQRNLVADFLDRGIPIPAGHFGALEQKLDFRALDTPYPFTLLFPQTATEQILERRARELGAEIRRGHRLVDFDEQSGGIVSRIAGPEGEYMLESAYIAGCDGAGSTVRKTAGIAFPGTDATTFGLLADVQLDEPPATPLFGFSGLTGQLMIVPLPGGGYRIVAVDPSRQQPPAGEVDFEEFRTSTISITGGDFGMHSPSWVSRYGNASRVAERYRRGRVVLAGDAAHIHFPAGGVGMNVGIQDAHGLGWRLADVVSGLAPADVLDDYHTERHAVGDDLVRGTQAQTAVLTAFDTDRQALRGLLNHLIATVPEFSNALAQRLSGLSVAYPGATGDHPLVGRRVPDVATEDGRLYEAFGHGEAVLVVFVGIGSALDEPLEAAHTTLVTAPADSSGPFAGLGAVLIRPDGHIAWAVDADALTTDDVEAALRRLRPALLSV